jgi:hypothetical protein
MERVRIRRGELPEGVSDEEMAKRRRLVTDSADQER